MIIDRFEGENAVVETDSGTFEQIPRSLLPPRAKEGDVISIIIMDTETTKREEEIRAKMNKLFQR